MIEPGLEPGAVQTPNHQSTKDRVDAKRLGRGDETSKVGPWEPSLPPSHLGSSGDCGIGSQVQAPLAHPHHGLIALVSGLCDVLVDFLRGGKGRNRR